MACTPGFIAAEGFRAPLGPRSRHAGVGALFFAPSIRNASVPFCCRPVGLGGLGEWGSLGVSGLVAGG